VDSLLPGRSTRDTISATAMSRCRHAGPSRAGTASLRAIAVTAATCPCGSDRVTVNSVPAATSCAPLSPASIQSTMWPGNADRLATVSLRTPLALAVGAPQIRRKVLAGVAQLVHVRLPDSDYVNLPAGPRHNKQLNAEACAFQADTPCILTTNNRRIRHYLQVSTTITRANYRNFGLKALDDRDVGGAAALAHRLQSVATAGALQRVQHRGEQLGACRTEGVTERDRAAAGIDLRSGRPWSLLATP